MPLNPCLRLCREPDPRRLSQVKGAGMEPSALHFPGQRPLERGLLLSAPFDRQAPLECSLQRKITHLEKGEPATPEPLLLQLHLLPLADEFSQIQPWQRLKTQGCSSCTWFLPQSSVPVVRDGMGGQGKGTEPFGMVIPGGWDGGRLS